MDFVGVVDCGGVLDSDRHITGSFSSSKAYNVSSEKLGMPSILVGKVKCVARP